MFSSTQIQSFNELELAVYRYVTNHLDAVPFMRIRELAENAHVSTTTVLHFCKKVGCNGFSEFRAMMKEELGRTNVHFLEQPASMNAFFSHMESKEMQVLLEEASSVIACQDEVLFIGIGNSGYICDYAARYFSNIGKFSFSVTDPFIPIQKRQTLSTVGVMLTVSGEVEQIIDFQKSLRASDSKIITITANDQSTSAFLSDIVLSYPANVQRMESGIDFTSQVPAVLIIESLARLVQKRLFE